jgi:hypothetical protein
MTGPGLVVPKGCTGDTVREGLETAARTQHRRVWAAESPMPPMGMERPASGCSKRESSQLAVSDSSSPVRLARDPLPLALHNVPRRRSKLRLNSPSNGSTLRSTDDLLMRHSQ